MTASAEPRVVARAPQKRIPDFFIVGHAKSGTTALYEMLRRHPQIYMPDNKEPWFFARDNPRPETRSKTFDQTGRYPETLEDYLSLFAAARADQLLGEASTSYIWARTAAARIAAVQPGARIIAILREPAAFVRSLHLQLVENCVETEKNLRRALALEQERREGRCIPRRAYWPQTLIYSDRVRYVEQLRRYHAVFPEDQVLVIIYDDFRADNEATVRTVLRFLDLADTHPIAVQQANPTVSVRSVRLDNLIRTIRAGRGPVSGAVKATVKRSTSWELRRSVLYPLRRRILYGDPPPPDESVMVELRRRFKPEVVALSDYLGRDLVTLWGYDSVE